MNRQATCLNGGNTAANVITVPDDCPYRAIRNSVYARVYSVLHAHRQTGISRVALTRKLIESGVSPAQAKYGICIVTSVRHRSDPDYRSPHRCAFTASETYWVERKGDWLRLHLRSEEDDALDARAV